MDETLIWAHNLYEQGMPDTPLHGTRLSRRSLDHVYIVHTYAGAVHSGGLKSKGRYTNARATKDSGHKTSREHELLRWYLLG